MGRGHQETAPHYFGYCLWARGRLNLLLEVLLGQQDADFQAQVDMVHEQRAGAEDQDPGKWSRRGELRVLEEASCSGVEGKDYNDLPQIRGEKKGWHSIHEGAVNVRSLN